MCVADLLLVLLANTPVHWAGHGSQSMVVEALERYDARELGGNDDGLITEADAVWTRLRIWVDLDADGVSTSAEMRTLTSCGIRALEAGPRSAGRGARADVLRETAAGRRPRVSPLSR
jgi:hypothetical protein